MYMCIYPIPNPIGTEQQMMLEKRKSQQNKNSSAEVEQLQAKLAKMQAALDESYDIIDEMDFELESVMKIKLVNNFASSNKPSHTHTGRFAGDAE